jgi:hypothetical protein
VDRYPPPARPATADASGTLTGCVNQVRARSGKSIPAGRAAQLIADAKRIRAVLAG